MKPAESAAPVSSFPTWTLPPPLGRTWGCASSWVGLASWGGVHMSGNADLASRLESQKVSKEGQLAAREFVLDAKAYGTRWPWLSGSRHMLCVLLAQALCSSHPGQQLLALNPSRQGSKSAAELDSTAYFWQLLDWRTVRRFLLVITEGACDPTGMAACCHTACDQSRRLQNCAICGICSLQAGGMHPLKEADVQNCSGHKRGPAAWPRPPIWREASCCLQELEAATRSLAGMQVS